MFENKSKALKYLVKITYSKTGLEGSAVLVPIDTEEDYSYLFTAKHTFGLNGFEQSDEGYHTIDINEIEKKDIILSNPENHEFEILEILDLGYDSSIDLVIFKIKKDSYIQRISPLSIYEDTFYEALAYGYPIMKEEDKEVKYQSFLGTYHKIDIKNKFELYLKDFSNIDEKQNTYDYVAGLSGGGVFVEDSKKEEIYLSGIVVNSGMGNSIKCIDILSISKMINKKLEDRNLKTISIGGAKWKDELGFDITDLDFEKIASDLSSNYKKNKFIKELHPYQEDKDKFINTFDLKVKNSLNKEINKLSESSQIYLYIAMKFHLFQENIRATKYFNKAIEYGGNKNKSYLLTAKEQREKKKNERIKTEQEEKFLLKSIEQLYNEMYEYEEQLKNNKDDEYIKKMLKNSYKELIEKLTILGDREYEINEISKKFVKLDFSEKDNIQEQILELKDMIEISQKFQIMTNEVNNYKEEIQKLNKYIQLLSAHVSDKTLLNQINYRVFNTDKKLDICSKSISFKIDKNTNKITKKLDEVKTTIIKTNNQKLNNFLENVYRSNQALVSKIQTMYHQNDRVNRKAKIALDNSIKIMNEKIEECLNRPISSDGQTSNNIQTDIEKIIKESNWSFYKAIQGLYEKESDSYNRKLLEMSIAFTKREHELHIEKLKKSHEIELLKIKDKNHSINSKKLSYISEQVSKVHQKLDNISGQLNRFQSNVIDIVKKNNKVLIEELTQIFPEKKDSLETFLEENDNEINNIDNLSMEQIKEVVSICNDFLYEEIKKLLQNNKDLSKQKIMEMAIELTKKDNEKAIFELEIMYKQKIQQIKEKQTELEKKLDNEKEELYQKNQLLAEYKKKEKEEKRVQEEKEKEHKEFMNQIKLKADLKNKIKLTNDKFYNTKNKIQSFTYAFNNVLEELNKEIQDIKQIIFTKKVEEKYHNIIKELNCKIEELEKVALKKIEDYHNRKEKERKTDIFIILGIVFLIISVYLIFEKIYKF